MRNIFLPIVSLIFFVNSAFASTVDNESNAKVLVQSSFARESIPGTSISSAYMAINNISTKDLRLISATSSVTDRIEIHEHTMANGLMRMRQVEYVDISAKDTVLFQPSGLHLMIFDLKQPLKAKENITITLHFDDQSSIDVNYTIKGLKQKKHHH